MSKVKESKSKLEAFLKATRVHAKALAKAYSDDRQLIAAWKDCEQLVACCEHDLVRHEAGEDLGPELRNDEGVVRPSGIDLVKANLADARKRLPKLREQVEALG